MIDKEKLRKTKQRYYLRHKEEINQKQRDDYTKNPEKYRKRHMKYYYKTKEKLAKDPVMKKTATTAKQDRQLKKFRKKILDTLSIIGCEKIYKLK